MRTAQEAAVEQERQDRLAAERREQDERRRAQEKRSAAVWAAERLEQEKRRAAEREAARRQWRERSRVVFLAIVSAARWLVQNTDRLLRWLSRHRWRAQARAGFVSVRRRVRKADWLLRRWAARLRNLDEAGKGRCLRLLLAILLIPVIVAGAVAVVGAVGMYQESCREQEKQELAQREKQESAQRRQSHWKAADSKARFTPLGNSGHFSDIHWESVANQSDPNYYAEKAEAYKTYWCRGLARLVVTGECGPAITDFTEAIRLDPDSKDAHAYIFRGFARCVMSEWEAAVADLTEAIRLAPNDARAYAFRSFAYAHGGDTKKAQDDRESAERLGFTPDEFTRLAEVME